MSTYPTTPAWVTPIVRTLKFSTGIHQSTDGHEQRWQDTTGVESFSLPYAFLSVSDRDTLLSFFESSKGAYDQTISLAYDGTHTFTGLYFDGDELLFTEDRPTLFSGVVKLTTVVRAPDTGSLPTFPALSTTAFAQRPYTKGSNFDTAGVRVDGARYAYARRTTALHTWTVGGSALTSTEAQAIYDMFRLAGGQFKSFAITDPESSVVASNCRFASDVIEWRILGPNQNQITSTVRELL